ncbi:spanin [Enterobacter phage EC151]|nr:spanin [Enterobacter phage EC151]
MLRNNWAIDKGKIEYEAQQRLNAANRDAKSARDLADSLQRTIDKVRSIASNAGVTVGPRTSTGKAVDMLADMLIESNRRANTYAEFADRAFEAGRTCELQYDAMRNRILEQQTAN